VRIAVVRRPRHRQVEVGHEENREQQRGQCSQNPQRSPAQPRSEDQADERGDHAERRQRALELGEGLHLSNAHVVAEGIDLEDVPLDPARADFDDESALAVLRRPRLHLPPGQKPRQRQCEQRHADQRAARHRIRSVLKPCLRCHGQCSAEASLLPFGSTNSQPIISMWSAEQNSVQ